MPPRAGRRVDPEVPPADGKALMTSLGDARPVAAVGRRGGARAGVVTALEATGAAGAIGTGSCRQRAEGHDGGETQGHGDPDDRGCQVAHPQVT